MRIDVTAEDIKKGRPVDAGACPVACAIRRLTGRRASVGCLILIRDAADKGWEFTVDVPRSVDAFIVRFDQGLPVDPISFEINYDPERLSPPEAAQKETK